MLANPYESRLTVKDITNSFIERHGMDYERKITTKWVGNIVRKRLGLHAYKSVGGDENDASEEPAGEIPVKDSSASF